MNYKARSKLIICKKKLIIYWKKEKESKVAEKILMAI